MKKRFEGIKIIMGLGNPEASYGNTYHNAGKLMVDWLSEFSGVDSGSAFRKSVPGGLFESRKADGIALVKPLNYMNENGKAAKLALKRFGGRAGSLMVAHDDSDVEIGQYKISFGSGSAGHNGVKSVIENVGTKNFWRLRIGVRKLAEATENRAKAGEFVLKKITKDDSEKMTSAFEKAAGEIFGGSI